MNNYTFLIIMLQNIRDWHLGIFVAVVVAIVLVLLVIGLSIPATRPRPFISQDGENHDRRNVGYVTTVILCCDAHSFLQYRNKESCRHSLSSIAIHRYLSFGYYFCTFTWERYRYTHSNKYNNKCTCKYTCLTIDT